MIFAYIYIGLSIAISIFQVALALGAPLGEFTLGGKFPGKLPAKMRIAAICQICVLFIFALIAVSKSGLALESFHNIARTGIWFVFAFFVLGSILNISSPSKKERVLMGPLNIIALICGFMIAIN